MAQNAAADGGMHLGFLLYNSARMLSYIEKPMYMRSNQIYRNTQEVWFSAENRCVHYKIWTQAGEPVKKVIVWQKA